MRLVYLTCLVACITLISACGALDDSSGGSDTTGGLLKGLWVGETEEQGVGEALTTFVLFVEEKVFILREDEAQIGSYEVKENGSAALDTIIYSYATPDTDNQFYVGSRTSNRFTMDALFASSESLFINFDGAGRSGSITTALDSARVSNLDLSRTRGIWSTTDSILYINDEGGFQGKNSATGCQWKGHLSSLSAGFLQLNIERKLCPEFNQSAGNPSSGFALIDGEGILHFIAEEGNEFMWMQFESDGTATAPDTPTEEPTEEEEAAA